MSSPHPRIANPHDQDFETRLRAAKDGAEWAWAEIYRDLAGAVAGYLANRGAAEPDDLTSETFLQIARNISTFEGDESAFRSWVFVIAHRRLIDSRRARQRRPETITLADPTGGGTGGDVEEEALNRLTTVELQSAFEKLSESQSDVLGLRIIGQLTLEETATVLGKRVGAVKAAQRRGLLALTHHLDLDGVTR
ncbi:MAG TPA: RNA polymerase sigma factor [Acidimicrobiia bacterium]|jgi:RNA polymerase sigma-70 factor (ECF subfamily)|nr:RNA polymerase sigma factor [Acidimicrobiia bacterium]